MKKQHNVVVQEWEESEKGWGERPDGFSLHLTSVDVKAFIDDYWQGMPDEVPNEYSRPCGEPYTAVVDSKTHKEVKTSKNGIRKWGTPPK